MWRLRLLLKRINKEKWLKYTGIALAAICVLSYTVFHISSLFSEEISTIVVGPVTESKSVSLNGYIFRDSAIVTSNYSGTVDYLVKNGEKLSANTQVANVYEGGSADTRELVSVIDEQIALLEKSTENSYSESDISYLRQSASNSYYSIMKQLASSDLSSLYSNSENLLIYLNGLAMVKDENFSIQSKLEALYDSREQILGNSGASEAVSVAQSAYFYSDVDGYEKAFTGEAALTLDGDALLRIMQNSTAETVADNCIGKMSTTARWYFAVNVDMDTLEQFEQDASYKLLFTGGGAYSINMNLQRILKCERSAGAVLVFSTNVIPSGFSFERQQTVKIELESISGIYVPMSAVHGTSQRKIVYVLNGSVVQQRRIEIVYEGADYYIVRDGVLDDDGDEYLQSNELLIIGGANLFDGRILE